MALRVQVKSALLYTPSSLCHVDFGAPAPSGGGKPRARRARIKPAEDIGTAGSNFRVLPLDNPCMLCAFTSPASALLVRRLFCPFLPIARRLGFMRTLCG